MNARPAPMWKMVSVGAVVLVIVVVAVAGLLWRHEGGRWYVVTTPSMGDALPVGSLIVTRPTSVDDVRDGRIVAFRATRTADVHSHRVISHGAAGLTTRGDVNAVPDPWVVTDEELVGEVVWHGRGWGWLLRTPPLLLLGIALTWLATLLVRRSRRYALRLIGVAATASAVAVLLHPWVGLTLMSQTTPDDGSPGVLVQVISTGLMPTEVSEADGEAIASLGNGDVEVLHLTRSAEGRFHLDGRPDLQWWGWALMALAVLSPLLWVLVRGLPPLSADDAEPVT